MTMKKPQDPTVPLKVEQGDRNSSRGPSNDQIRALVSHCWAWGAVAAYRDAGGIGYPSTSELTGQRYRKTGGQSICNLGATYADIEKTLTNQPLVMRGLLMFQYGRPYRLEGAGRSVQDYVAFVFGEDMSPTDARSVAKALKAVRRFWWLSAADELFRETLRRG